MPSTSTCATAGLLEQLRCLEAPLAEPDDIKRVHRPAYVDLIFENAPTEGYAQLDPDTAMNPYSLAAARRAAGAGLLAVDEVMAGRADNAFCAVRPCGHHATQSRAMGFCIFNNIGVAAAYAVKPKASSAWPSSISTCITATARRTCSARRNGRARDHGGFLSASLLSGHRHRHPAPNMFNVPLAAGSDGAAARDAFEHTGCRHSTHFKPQMILISAGFDAHREDLLGGMALVEADYAWMTRELMAVAAGHARRPHRLHARGRLQPLGAGAQRRGAREDARRALTPPARAA